MRRPAAALGLLIALSWLPAHAVDLRLKFRATGSGTSPATFVAANVHAYAATTETFSFPAGASPGDLLLFYAQNSTSTGETYKTTSDSAAFTNLVYDALPGGGGTTTSLGYKVLTSGEIANGQMTVTGASTSGGLVMSLYHMTGSAAAAAKVSSYSTNVTSQTLAGFTPAFNTAGVVFVAYDRDTGAATLSMSPGTWASRANAQPGLYFRFFAQDLLTGYTNATTTISGYDNSGAAYKNSYLVELTQ